MRVAVDKEFKYTDILFVAVNSMLEHEIQERVSEVSDYYGFECELIDYKEYVRRLKNAS